VEAHYHSETDSYYFKIFKEGESYNLTQLGTGVSQVLPILVMCLAAEDGSTLIIDQPEMYLHPSMQAKLADFFFTITKYGSKQCIIESHSIFLIDQLRLRIAQEPIVHHSKKDSKFNLAELEHPGNRHVKIYFTENKNQNTNFRSVEIDEYGVPSEWPGEFFNVSLDIEDKLFEAVEIKRKKYEDMARD
jgi:predicted ATPase